MCGRTLGWVAFWAPQISFGFALHLNVRVPWCFLPRVCFSVCVLQRITQEDSGEVHDGIVYDLETVTLHDLVASS